MNRSPEPALTASLYASGGLDALIQHAIGPLARRLESRSDAAEGYIWLMRYDCRGEHLKVRLHGPSEWADAARSLLPELATRAFESLPDGAESPPMGVMAPPIDEDDQGDEPYPPKTLRWTSYRRSPIVFSDGPLLEDDEYIARMTRCLGFACEQAVAALSPADASAPATPNQRQRVVFKAVLRGLVALGFSASQRDDYLAYHRDWLIRTLVLKADRRLGAKDALATRTVERFDAQASKLEQIITMLRQGLEAVWGDASEPIESGAESQDGWSRSLNELASYLTPFADEPSYQIDPFAKGFVFPPLFKVLHGLSNQLGFPMINEAFLYHLFLTSASRSEARGVTMIPDNAW